METGEHQVGGEGLRKIIIDRGQQGGPIESVHGSPFFSLHGNETRKRPLRREYRTNDSTPELSGAPEKAHSQDVGERALSRHNFVHVAQCTHAVTHVIHVMPHGIHAPDHGICLLVNTVH